MIRALMVIVLLFGAAAWFVGPPIFLQSKEPEPAIIVMPPEVSWRPAALGEGRLFVLEVTASEHTPLLGVHGSLGSEELHFRLVGDGVFESVAAVPVGAGAVVEADLRVVYAAGAEERMTQSVPVVPGVYAHEELRVAPRFGAPLGSADRARLARDQAVAGAATVAAHRTPRLLSGQIVLPRESRVTSGFGDGRVFNGQLSSRHMGLDLQGGLGDTVVAAGQGVVAVVAPFLLAGNVVYVNHGAGLLSAYFHLSEQLVSVGDTVTGGTPVGRVGATGRVTGPHLHWVVRYGRTSVDPRSLLDVFAPG